MEHRQKIEYLITLFFTTDRLIREKSQGEGLDPLSMLHLEVLRLIDAEEPTMKRIAEHLRIKAPSATSLVAGLAKAGLVSRVKDRGDRRVVRLRATAKGKRKLVEGTRRIVEKTKEIISHLKQRQIDDFIKIMQEIEAAYT